MSEKMLLSTHLSFCILRLLLIIITGSLVYVSCLDKTMIHTATGPIKGTFIDSFGVKYYSYQGIPYAEKPTGDLRFKIGCIGISFLNEEGASGNAGLKDIVLALQWVNDNVDRFGGDRNKTTIGGNSAGSVAAQYLLLSTKSIGLFSQAILLSGSALGYRFLSRQPKQNAIVLGKELGTTYNHSKELLEQLKQVDAFDIIKAQEGMGKNDTRQGFRPFAPFVPCLEIEYVEAFITKEPRTILKAGIPNNVPILVGFNSDEGLKMYQTIKQNGKFLSYLNEDFQLCIPSDIGYPHGSEEAKELARSIRNFYFDDDYISDATIQNFVDLVTDTMFARSIEYGIQLYKDKASSKKLYFYEFAFDGLLNLKVANKLDRLGTAHGDEVGYLFVNNLTKPIICHTDDRSHRMLDIMTGIITNFVKFGNPTPEKNKIGIVWEECGKERNYLFIDDQLKNVASRPIPKRLQYWQDAYDHYYRYMENGGEIEYNIVP